MMHWRQDNQKLAALAFGTLECAIQISNRKPCAQSVSKLFNIHGLVEMAMRRIGAIEVQRVLARQISKGSVSVCGLRRHAVRVMPERYAPQTETWQNGYDLML
jgi:hypothetical protein